MQIAIANTTPQQIVCVNEDDAAQAALLTQHAQVTAIADTAGLAAVEDTYRQIRDHKKRIMDGRLAATKPLDELKQAAIQAVEDHLRPLVMAEERLKRLILAFRTKIEEEARRLREESQRKAEEEARRRQAEADAQRAQAEALRQQQIELTGESDVEVPAAVQVQVEVPVLPAVPDLKPSPVSKVKKYALIVDNPALVPVQIGGKELRPIDEKAVRDCLKLGIQVPGCRLVLEEGVRASGR